MRNDRYCVQVSIADLNTVVMQVKNAFHRRARLLRIRGREEITEHRLQAVIAAAIAAKDYAHGLAAHAVAIVAILAPPGRSVPGRPR